MSPTNFHDHHHAKNNNNNDANGHCPLPLKINKESHMIKKSSSSSSSLSPSSSSSSSASSLGVAGPTKPPQQQRPVIIYTHSPKVIHTHPKDFMTLVQKLTGLSRSDDDHAPQAKQEKCNATAEEDSKNGKIIGNEDNESSSVITDENCGGSNGDHGQVNSCLVTPIFEPSNPYMTNIPVFTPNSADFLGSNLPFYTYTDSLFFPATPPNMRSSITSSSSNIDGMNADQFREY